MKIRITANAHYTVVVIFASLVLAVIAQAPATNDGNALTSLSNSILALRDAPYGWTGTADCTLWKGITCNAGNRVTHLNISLPDASGTLPTQLQALNAMIEFSIEANLTGTIPGNIGVWTSLTKFVLKAQKFISTANFNFLGGSLNSLVHLELQSVRYTGTSLPSPLPFGNSLRVLIMNDAEFSGDAPDLSNVTAALIQKMSMNRNSFSGSLPAWMAGLINCTYLDLSYNGFTGAIPPDIQNLRKLTYLNIANNNLPSLPLEMATLPLETLNVSNNPTLSGDFSQICEELKDTLILCDLSGDNYTCDPECLICDCLPPPTSTTTPVTSTSDTTVADTSVTTATSATSASSVTTATTATSTSATTATTATTASTATTATTATTASTATTSTSTTGSTTNPSCSGYECICSSNLTDLASTELQCDRGSWTIPGSANNTGKVVIGGEDIVKVNGSYSQGEDSILEIHPGGTGGSQPYVQASGGIILNGTLVIVLNEKPNGTTTLPIVNGTSISGSFSSVEIVKNYSSSNCQKNKAETKYEETSVSVLLVSSTGCPWTTKHRVVIIAVAAAIAAIIIILVVIAIIVVVVVVKSKRRHQGLTSAPSTMDNSQELM